MFVTKYTQEDIQKRKDAKLLAIVIAALLVMLGGAELHKNVSEKKAQRKLEQRNAARGQDFANYVFDDVKTYVLQNMPSQRKINAEAAHYDPDYQDSHIQHLVQDSTKYADAIVRDAPVVISGLDGTRIYEYTMPGDKKPTVETLSKSFRTTLRENGDTYTSFDKAMEHIQSQQALITGPEYRLEPWSEEEGGLRRGYEHVPTGKTIVKGSNTSESYKMKINIGHLKEICKELAYARAVKAQAVRNAKSRGK